MLAELIAGQRPRLLAHLVRRFGLAHLALAEDAVQQACLRALDHWPREGQPTNAAGWLLRVAEHWAIDQLRAARPLQAWDDLPAEQTEAFAAAPTASARFAGELDDDELALLFAACHPAVPPASQVALALRSLTALPLDTLADALLTTEAGLAQRLARARQALAGVSLTVPTGPELPARCEAVLATLLVMFGEGMKASGRQGDRQAGEAHAQALCWEAIRLARAVAAHPRTASGEADALAALLLLHGARLSGRLDEAGDIVPLPGQARDRWDAGMIRMGLAHLQASQGTPAERGSGPATSHAPLLTRYHVLAGIAAEHALAPTPARTHWPRIVAGYVLLLRLDPSPAPRLGHAIALAEAGEPAQALAAMARAHERLGDTAQALARLSEAIACVRHPADARMLQARARTLAAAAQRRATPPCR